MVAVRHYLRDTATNEGTGGIVFDLSLTQGTPATTTAQTNLDTFVEQAAWQRTVGADVDGTSYPWSLDVPSISGVLEFRMRIQRVNSSNVVQASSSYSSLFTTAGTKTGTFTLTDGFVAGDRIRFVLESRRTSGHGNVSANISVNDADCYVDVPITVPPITLAYASRTPTRTAIALTVPVPPSAVITIATHGTTLVSGTDLTEYTLASRTYLAGNAYLMGVMASAFGTDPVAPTTPTNWTHVISSDVIADAGNASVRYRIHLYARVFSSEVTEATTLTFTTASSCVAFTRQLTSSGTFNISNLAVQSAKNTGTAATSLTVTLAAASHADNAVYMAVVIPGTTTATAETGFTILESGNNPASPNSRTTDIWNNDSADITPTVNYGATAVNSTGLAVELRATVGGAVSLAYASRSSTRTAIAITTPAALAYRSATGTRTAIALDASLAIAYTSQTGTRSALSAGTVAAIALWSATGTRTALAADVSAGLAYASSTPTRSAVALETPSALAYRSATPTRTRASLQVTDVVDIEYGSHTGTRTAIAATAPVSMSLRSATGTRTAVAATTEATVALASSTGTRTAVALGTGVQAAYGSATGTRTAVALTVTDVTTIAYRSTTPTRTALAAEAPVALAYGSRTGTRSAVTIADEAGTLAYRSATSTRSALAAVAATTLAYGSATGTRTATSASTAVLVAYSSPTGTRTALALTVTEATRLAYASSTPTRTGIALTVAVVVLAFRTATPTRTRIRLVEPGQRWPATLVGAVTVTPLVGAGSLTVRPAASGSLGMAPLVAGSVAAPPLVAGGLTLRERVGGIVTLAVEEP